MKTFRVIGMALVAVLLSIGIVSCSDDDEDGNLGSVESVTANITGVWYCTYQQWTEDGETNSNTYEPSSTYSMRFNADGTGAMQSGSDELFEVGRAHDFTWNINKSNGNTYVHTSVYSGQTYKIEQLSSTSLTMTWTDKDYSIKCKFVKHK